MRPGRLTRRFEFLRAAQHGRKAANPGVVMQIYDRADGAPLRLGFTATRKLGNAVVRNRTKRRLRAAARFALADAAGASLDIVLIGREATRARPFAALQNDMRAALRRLAGLP